MPRTHNLVAKAAKGNREGKASQAGKDNPVFKVAGSRVCRVELTLSKLKSRQQMKSGR
jgi:hypothetical protein